MSEIALMSLRFLPASALGLSAIAILVGMISLTAGWWRWRVLSQRWQPVHHRG